MRKSCFLCVRKSNCSFFFVLFFVRIYVGVLIAPVVEWFTLSFYSRSELFTTLRRGKKIVYTYIFLKKTKGTT